LQILRILLIIRKMSSKCFIQKFWPQNVSLTIFSSKVLCWDFL
jgi:hypothetical protein